MLKNATLFMLGLATLGQAAFLSAQEAPATPLLKGAPYLQAMGTDSLTIVWHTTRPAYSWVNYREEGSTNEPLKAISSTYGLRDVGCVQKITLSHLKPATTYLYEINSLEVKDLQAYKFTFGEEMSLKEKNGKPLSFTTWPEEANTFSFVMINDLHDDNAKHARLLEVCGAQNVPFICYNGDIVTDKMSGEDVFTSFLNIPMESYSWEKPFFMLRGNHETRGAFSRQLHTFFPTATDQFYYTFQYGDVFFVNLDCGEDKADTSKEYGGLVDFDAYRTEQIAWLKQVVKSPAYKKARYRVFFCHIPPVGGEEMGVQLRITQKDGTVKTATDFGEAPWHGDLEIRNKFLPFLLDNKADLLLCGHYHQLINCDYQRGKTILPALINDNDTGVRLDVTPQAITLHVLNQKGEVLTTKEIPARHKPYPRVFGKRAKLSRHITPSIH